MQIDKLKYHIYQTRTEMGMEAARDIADCMKNMLEQREEINMIFAAAPSQNEMLSSLCEIEGICWERINAFHMDEYIGLSATAPQKFGNYLKEHIFEKKPFKTVNYINSDVTDKETECERYTELLKKFPTDIVCMGLGENAHIAFNDPHVADFNDKKSVKTVSLDEICRMQQVNDGCFAKLEDVPKFALTVTVPELMKAAYHFCVVPSSTKASAVYNVLNKEISEKYPGSILRTKNNCYLYCDSESAALLKKITGEY